MTDVLARIAALQAAPKRFAVVTRYEDGRTRSLETATEAQAENHAVGERRRIGRSFIDRDTAQTVKVVGVDVVAL